MSGALTSASAALLTVLLWRVARDAALRRGLHPGTFPLPLLAALAVTVAVRPSPTAIAVLAVASTAAVVDARTGVIPDPLTAAAAVAASLAAAIAGSPGDGARGAVAGAALPLFLYVVTRGGGIGFGDVKLAAVLGIALGPRGALLTIAGAFGCGAVVALWLLATRRAHAGDALTFAPFLAVSAYGAVAAGAVP